MAINHSKNCTVLAVHEWNGYMSLWVLVSENNYDWEHSRSAIRIRYIMLVNHKASNMTTTFYMYL